jgi:NAD(P)-dependent dehydrogenase (short-subunit alcohol dehydrogenase family)
VARQFEPFDAHRAEESQVADGGAGIRIGALEQQTDASIAECIAVNLTGVMLGCRRVVPVMKQRKSGTIVNVTSLCDRYAWPGWGVYSAAKAGVAMLSKCLYAEVREHGLRVTTLAPSWGQTDFIAAAHIPGHPSGQAGIKEKVTKPLELGEIVADLCALPAHLEIQDLVVMPTVQEIMPL